MAKIWKKYAVVFVAVLMALVMAFGMTACNPTDPDPEPDPNPIDPDPDPEPNPDPTGDELTVTISQTTAFLNKDETLQLTATASDGSAITWASSNDAIATVNNSGLVTAVQLGEATITATAGKDEDAVEASCIVTVDEPLSGDAGVYTYRTAVDSLPTAWNIHTYQSNAATYILDYTEDLLYDFNYNETKDGYVLEPSMASADPEDVSSQYVGQYGISEGDTWKAIKITLRKNLKFADGKEIKAKDFVESIKLLLNPDAANYRADSLYGGSFSIYNAEAYAKNGTYAYSAMVSANYGADEYFNPNTLTTGEDGYLHKGELDVAININSGGNWGSYGLATYYAAGYFNVEGWETFAAKADSKGYIKLDAAGLKIVQDAIAQLQGYDNVEAYYEAQGEYAYEEWEEMCLFGKDWPELDWSQVGVKAMDDYTLVFFIEKPLSGFYLKYALTSSMFLVDTELYKSCESTSQGAYTNSYGTSVATYNSFGPYKLVTFVADSIATFAKNTYWWGYSDTSRSGQYQTTNISIRQVSQASTRLQMFLAGKLDSYGLQAADMEDYQSSNHLYYTEGDSTWFIALNPDYDALVAAQDNATPSASGKVVNKTVLTIKEFRQALSFSVDRSAYELALDPLGTPAFALFGNMIISDPENATAYRTTDEAKKVILNFWGISEDDIGEGKEYETVDDAIASITGYDLAGAKTLFTEAYDKAVELKYIDPDTDWEVQIVIGQPGSGSSAYYNNGYTLLSKVWTEAVKGTPFEGRLVFTQSQPLGSTNFATYLQSNQIDLLFGVGWTGSALDPYSLMEAYVTPSYQYDPGWDTSTTTLDIALKVGDETKTLRASVYDWGYLALQGNDIKTYVVGEDGKITTETVTINAGASADATMRLEILAAVENAVLQQYDMIPVGFECTASLKGARIKFYTEDYVYGVGRGGLRYYTYSMDDAAWATYVSSQGGTLNYK